MNTKKGISPLIATVLLIVLSVALAAMVMTWVLNLTKDATTEANKQMEEQQKCSALDFEITDVNCGEGKVIVQSNTDVEISNVTLRVFRGADSTAVSGPGIQALSSHADTQVDLTGATKVEALAYVKSSYGGSILCNGIVKEFIPDCS